MAGRFDFRSDDHAKRQIEEAPPEMSESIRSSVFSGVYQVDSVGDDSGQDRGPDEGRGLADRQGSNSSRAPSAWLSYNGPPAMAADM